jgi:hypothetical protein
MPGFYIVIGVTFLGITTSQAAIGKVHANHHHVRVVKALQTKPAPRRFCDWIGPGGRAVYRCSFVDPEPLIVSQNNIVPQQRTCDWIGPGGRAVYRCR